MTTASPPRPAPSPQPARRQAARVKPAPAPRPKKARPPRRRSTTAALYVELLLTVLAVAAGAAAFERFFAGLVWIVPVAAALLLGAGLAALFAWRRWPGWLLTPVAVLVLAVFQMLALYWDTTNSGLPTLKTLTALGDGLLSGWARMLTVALPADPDGDLLATPTLLVFAAGVVSGVLVLRTKAVVGLAAAPVLVFTAGLLFTASRAGDELVLTGVLLALLAVLLLVRTNRQSAADDGLAEAQAGAVGLDLAAQRRHSTAGRVLIGLPAAAVVLALAVAGGMFLPIADGSDRADPRSLVNPEVDQTTGLSPLVEVRPQRDLSPAIDLYKVTVAADAPAVDRIRLAALDTFDGALWGQSGQFVPAGSVLPAIRPRPARAVDVTLQIQVLTERSPFLPVVGEPERLSGVPVAVNTDNGNLIATASDDDTPAITAGSTSYDLLATVVPPAGVNEAAIAPDASRYTVLVDRPDWVDPLAHGIADEWETSWEKLQALRDDLYARPYSSAARPGQSYGALYRVLLGQPGEQFGYAEQYASAFAVLARALGFPTRIAVGYQLDEARRSADTYTVTTADAHAWPEVLLDGYGWVAFEPTNIDSDQGPPPEIDPEVPQLPQTPTNPQTGEKDDQGPPGTEVTAAAIPAPVLIGLFVVGGMLLLVVLLIAGIVLAKKVRRTRRRSTGTPARRIAAAWQEVRDRLREAGHPTVASRTPGEVADEIGRSAVGTGGLGKGGLGKAQVVLTELAVIVTSAVSAPTAPTPVAAKQAWALHDTVVKALTERRPVWARFLALIDPRPLLPGAGRLAAEPAPDTAKHQAKKPARV